jgi:predicted acyl esterase
MTRRVLAFAALLCLAAAPAAAAQERAGPVFANGQAQIVPEFQDPSGWIRHDLWVETRFDSDGDGRRDRMHVDVTRPGQTDTEGLEVPVVYATSPYYAGTASTQPQYFWNVDHELGTAPPPRLSPPPIPHQSLRPIISNSEVSTWVPRGFAVVHSESPGTGLSEGCPTVGAINESLAPKAVIEWLNGRAKGYTTRDGDVEVDARWSTGKVGMTGTSYNGTLPLAAATTGVEGLEAIIPIAPNTSYYHYYRSNGLVRNPGGWVGEDIDYLFDYINSGYPENRQYCIDTVRVGEMNAFQDRVTGDYNRFWAGRDYLNAVRGVEAPTLMAHAFNDWNVVPEHSVRIYEALKRQGTRVQAYYHQGGHGGAPPLALRNRWFTRYLYGLRNGVERDPRAWITREAASCPPRTATVVGDQTNTATLTVDDTRRLQLGMTLTVPVTNADGTVVDVTRVIDSIRDARTIVLASAVATGAGERVAAGTTVGIVCGSANPTPYADYPNPAASRVKLRPQRGGEETGGLSPSRPRKAVETLVDDVSCQAGTLAQAASSPHRLLYATPELGAPLHLSGTPRVRVRLASSKPAANLSVWLVTLPWTGAAPCTGPPTPTANLVTRAWADPQNRHSLSRSRPLRPGRFYDVSFPLQPDDQVIPAGRRLGLMIFSSDREFTLRPQPGTELKVDLRGTSLELPVVGGSRALDRAVGR